jgi:hypothetical protein
MTSPSIIFSETVGDEIFEISRDLFVGLRASSEVRRVYSVRKAESSSREELSRIVWDARWKAARAGSRPDPLAAPQ